MKVVFVNDLTLLFPISERTFVIDFSDAGETRYLYEDTKFFEKDIAREKEPSVTNTLFAPLSDDFGKGCYQVWDELVLPHVKKGNRVLFNDPIRMGESYEMNANDELFRTFKTQDMIKSFITWLGKRGCTDLLYILCSKNSFVRKIQI
jgi:hypothetical protein